jgi:hypothetical protein
MNNFQLELASQDAYTEVLRAKQIHGDKPFNGIHEGYAVLLEEVDELWDEVKKNPRKYPGGSGLHRDAMRKEAIQVAAMALRFAAELTPVAVPKEITEESGNHLSLLLEAHQS